MGVQKMMGEVAYTLPDYVEMEVEMIVVIEK
jgi:hypothetical protein